MKRDPTLCTLRILLLLVLATGFAVCAQDTSNPKTTLTLPEYREQINSLLKRTATLATAPQQAREISAQLPDHIVVNAQGREYSINYSWLKTRLTDFESVNPKHRDEVLERIREKLTLIEKQAMDFDAAVAAPAGAGSKLKAILESREFRGVHGPNAMDLLKERALRWLGRLLGRFFIRVGSHSGSLQVVSYVIMGAAIIILTIWVWRRFNPTYVELPREILPFAPSARGWRTWLAEAHARAQLGEWRDAIHLAYWAAIAFLETAGAWKPDRARTPREYLRLLSERHPSFNTLGSVTRKFEAVWYASQAANATDFAETLAHLEKIGCR